MNDKTNPTLKQSFNYKVCVTHLEFRGDFVKEKYGLPPLHRKNGCTTDNLVRLQLVQP